MRVDLAELIVLEEAGRGDFGARLHDGPVQDQLATRYLADLALSAAAKGADAETLRLHLEGIRDAAALALSGSRKLMGELTGRCLDGRGLAGALRQTVAAANPDATVVTGDEHDTELGELPPAVAVVAYRLAAALARTFEGPGTLTARRDAGELVLTLDAMADLGDPAVSSWVDRALTLRAAVFSADDTITARFPLASP